MNQMIREIGLEDFEQKVYGGHYLEGLKLLITLLEKQHSFDVIPIDGEGTEEYKKRVQLSIDRCAGAVTALFSSNQWNLSESNFEFLMQFKNQLVKLYTASSFNTTEHLFSILSAIEFTDQADKARRFQLFVHLESKPELIQAIVFQPKVYLATIIWMVTELSLSNGNQEDFRDVLIDLLVARSKNQAIPNFVLRRLARPYMFCSYLINDKRHLVKLALNQMIKNRFKTNYLSYNRGVNTKKPILLVMIENFVEGHAMFRCYFNLLKSLKEQFFVVFVAKSNALDNGSKDLYDKLITVDLSIDVDFKYEKLAKSLAKLNPSMVFYPSVGMDAWTSVLANFRIAPVQCMALGHPATSCSDNMDYAISDCFNDVMCFTEKLIAIKNNRVPFVKPKFNLSSKFKIIEGEIHIAVVSSFMKINSIFLEVCKEIQRRTDKKVVYHFFPLADGVFYHYFSKIIKESLSHARIYKSMNYNAFINAISICQLRLGTFPFGGTNTNIDCFALGIPFVCLDGPEAFSHQDKVFFERINFPFNLVAKDLEEYLNLAIDLINKEDLRTEISCEMIKTYNSNLLFEDEDSATRGITAETLMWILRNNEKLKLTDKQLIIEGSEL